MGIAMPGDNERWRCTGCGNLTRFDVTRTVRSRDFVHLDLSGEGRVEERSVLSETIEQVTCRWCGAADRIETIARPDADRSVSDTSAESPTGRA
ncbi:hypothetical protein SUDANB121_04965 [Nocardiopsis dassonvillei]|uniref:hypothetical protein n=1 Tax=Nocardiopsis dassonvillei TaxID=2014 RepID=UPI003F57E8C7